MKESPEACTTTHQRYEQDMHHQPEQIWIENDAVLPTQFGRQSIQATGERRLLVAILTDAIDCLQRYSQVDTVRGRRLFAETLAWVLEEKEEHLYSFGSICHHLDIDRGNLRAGLLTWLADRGISQSVDPEVVQQHGGRGRPSKSCVWVRQVRPGVWCCYASVEGLIYTMGRYCSLDGAQKRKVRVEDQGIRRSVELLVARRESEEAA